MHLMEFSWTRSFPRDQMAGIDQVYGPTILHVQTTLPSH